MPDRLTLVLGCCAGACGRDEADPGRRRRPRDVWRWWRCGRRRRGLGRGVLTREVYPFLSNRLYHVAFGAVCWKRGRYSTGFRSAQEKVNPTLRPRITLIRRDLAKSSRFRVESVEQTTLLIYLWVPKRLLLASRPSSAPVGRLPRARLLRRPALPPARAARACARPLPGVLLAVLTVVLGSQLASH